MTGPFRRLTQLPDAHEYDEDPKAHVCLQCPLPEAHEVHSKAAIEAEQNKRAGWLAEEQRRMGERSGS